MAFFNGTIAGYKLLNDLSATISSNLVMNALDLGSIVGRTELSGDVVALSRPAAIKNWHYFLDLDCKKKYAVEDGNPLRIPRGAVKFMYPFEADFRVRGLGSCVLFTKLDFDVRVTIYKLAVTGRTIPFLEVMRGGHGRGLIANCHTHPDIMLATSEAGLYLQRSSMYKDKFLFDDHDRKIWIAPAYDNFSLDSVILRNTFPTPFIPFLKLHGKFDDREDILMIRRLQLHWNVFTRGYLWALDNMALMFKLQSVDIYGSVIDPEHVGPPKTIDISVQGCRNENDVFCTYPIFHHEDGTDRPGLEFDNEMAGLPTHIQAAMMNDLFRTMNRLYVALDVGEIYPGPSHIRIQFVSPHPYFCQPIASA